MTIGFATTYLADGQSSFLLTADRRHSTPSNVNSDMAVKVYALNSHVGAITAGTSTSCASAAELTRGITDDQAHLTPDDPVSFYNTVRLFAYFLDHVDRQNQWSDGCEVVLAGFLANGVPALAKVRTSKGARTRIDCFTHERPGHLVSMVGVPDAKRQVISAMHRALQHGEGWVQRAVAEIWHLCQSHMKVGGAPSVALCERSGPGVWFPFVRIGDRTFLRGFDMSETRFQPAQVLVVPYEEDWHWGVNSDDPPMPPVRKDEGFVALESYVEDFAKPDQVLSNWVRDPAKLTVDPNLQQSHHVAVIVQPYEIPSLALPSG